MGKKKILVVDDHPATCHGISQLIAATQDLEVCAEAGDKGEAFDAVRKTLPDLAIIDISLRDSRTSGLDLIGELHSQFGDVPILVVSMHDETLYAERALRCGARGYLMKQEPVREIIRAARIILEGGIYLSSRMNELLLKRLIGQHGQHPDASLVNSLSEREFAVFSLLGSGLSTREIAGKLFISDKTVETHKLNIRKKLGYHSIRELIQFAIHWSSHSMPFYS